MNPWLESLAAALIALFAYMLGRWFSRLPKPWWAIGYFIPLGLILLYCAAIFEPWLTAHPPISWMLMGRSRFVSFNFVTTMLLAAPLARPPQKRNRAVVCLLIFVLSSLSLLPFLAPAFNHSYLSVAAHFMALAGIAIPGGGLVWGLHIGIFFVWIPTILVANRITRYSNRKDFWKSALIGCPLWMRRTLYVVFGYAIFNFILFMLATTTQPKPTGAAPSSIIRGFSGHWMVFYGAGFATLYSVIHAPHLLRERKCPQGHSVAPTARFCPDCGYAFPDAREST